MRHETTRETLFMYHILVHCSLRRLRTLRRLQTNESSWFVLEISIDNSSKFAGRERSTSLVVHSQSTVVRKIECLPLRQISCFFSTPSIRKQQQQRYAQDDIYPLD